MHDFTPLVVRSVHRETDDCLVVTLDLPEGRRADFLYKPGQHLTICAAPDGSEIRRTYSICSRPEDAGLAVAIKRIPGGQFSEWAHAALTAGMTLDVLPPSGRFVLPEARGARGHVAAFAAGAGITPVIAMAEHALARPDGRRFTLIYGNRDSDSIIFRERLEDLKDKHLERFTLVHVMSRSEASDTPMLDGRIDGDKVAAFARHIFRLEDVDDYFVCGPGSMIKEVRQSLMALGVPREHIHHEFFAPAGGAAVPREMGAPVQVTSEAAGAEIEGLAIIDGVRRRFPWRPGEALLDAALRAGLRVPYSCKGGMCSTCRAKVTEGDVAMRLNYSLEPWETEQGFVLTCQTVAKPGCARVVIDYDQM
jgi:ring-1,2-phenylacetyl-CoA epoxidase subunit PaaE